MKVYLEELKLSPKTSRDVVIAMVNESNDSMFSWFELFFLRLFKD